MDKALSNTSEATIKQDGRNRWMIECMFIKYEGSRPRSQRIRYTGYLTREEAMNDSLHARLACGRGSAWETIHSRRVQAQARSSSFASGPALLFDTITDKLITIAYRQGNLRLKQLCETGVLLGDGDTYLQRIQEGKKLNIVQQLQLGALSGIGKPLCAIAYKQLLANAENGHGGVSVAVYEAMLEKDKNSRVGSGHLTVTGVEYVASQRKKVLEKRVDERYQTISNLLEAVMSDSTEEAFLVNEKKEDVDGSTITSNADLSVAGKEKLRVKVLTMILLHEWLVTRDADEMIRIDNFEAALAQLRATLVTSEDVVLVQLDMQLLAEDFHDSKIIWKANNTMKRGYSVVEKLTSKGYPVPASTVESYWYEFNKNSHHFVRDQRGTYERENLLELHDQVVNFILFLRSASKSQDLTIDRVHQFVEGILFAGIVDHRDEKPITVSRTTVYHWMILYGASYDVHTKVSNRSKSRL